MASTQHESVCIACLSTPEGERHYEGIPATPIADDPQKIFLAYSTAQNSIPFLDILCL
jgi:hypothetical protein